MKAGGAIITLVYYIAGWNKLVNSRDRKAQLRRMLETVDNGQQPGRTYVLHVFPSLTTGVSEFSGSARFFAADVLGHVENRTP